MTETPNINRILDLSQHNLIRVEHAAVKVDEADHQMGMVADKGLQAEKAVENTGLHFQQEVLNTILKPMNKDRKQFQIECHSIVEQFGEKHVFGVLILPVEPLHFTHSLTETPTNEISPKLYYGRARIRPQSNEKGTIYFMDIWVVGAKMSEFMRDDIKGLGTAAAIETRKSINAQVSEALQGECSGNEIKSLGDIRHVDTVLPVLQQQIQFGSSPIHDKVERVGSRRQIITLADLAHTHDIPQVSAQSLGKSLITESTALNPLVPRESQMITVHPNSADRHFTIFPITADITQNSTSQVSKSDRALASTVLGVNYTFGIEGMNQITRQIIEPSNKGVAVNIRDIQRRKNS